MKLKWLITRGGASGSGIQVTKKAKERLKDIYEEKVKFLELVSKSAKETIEKHNKTLEELNKTTQNLKEEYEKTTTTNERKVEIHVLISRLTQSADGLRNTIRHLIQLQLEFESLVARHNEITKGIKSNTHSYRDVFDFDDAFLKRLQSVEKDNVYKLDNTTRRYLIQFKSIWRSYVSEFNLEFEQQLSITKKGEKLTDLRAQIAKDKALYAKLNAEYKNEESLYNILQNIQTSPHKEAIEKIQKLLDAKNSKFAELSSSNLYFEKLMPPYTLINKVDKTQNENIGNLIIELEEKVKSSYFNDELIKKLNKAKNDIEDNNSELNKAKEKSKQALVSSGLQSELDALNSAKAEYLKVVDKFSQTYINRIYAKGVMSYISAERATNVVSEYEELVAKITSLADTKDGVTFIINNIEGIENQLALDQDKTLIEAVEQIRKIEKMTTDLVEKAKNILDHQDVKPYLDMIENMFSEFVSKARSLFSSNYINDPIISKLLEEVNAKKLEAIKNQFSATGKDESLEKYKQMISEGFKKTIDALLYTKENEQSLAALRTYFSAILTNSEFKNNKGLEWAKIAFMKLVNIEQARAQSQDLTKIQAELSETNTKVTTVENEIKALDQTIKTYTDQIATASSREEKIKISQELKPYLAQRDDKHKELASLKLAVKYLTSRSESTLAEKLNKAKVAFGINEVNITKELLFDISSASGAVAQRLQDVFNQNIKKYIKQIEKVDSILKPAKDYLVSFNDKYLKLLNPSIDTYSKASEHKTNALKDSISKLIDARIREIQLEGREKELYANNSDELVNADDLVVAKSKSELLDILASKKLIEADKIKEANKDIYYVKLSNVEKDKSKLVVTLRNIAKNPDLAYSKIYTEKYIKFNLDASVEDQRLKVVNAIFNISNFKKQITPTLIREEGNIRDRFGKSVKGYSVFVDAYEDMTSTLLREVPYAGEWLEGEHLVSKINEDGVMEFSVQNGKYLGFTKDTRVGLWAILKMSDPNFKGISTDFLKFVGAHEYGHHITLNGAHDLGNKGEKPIYVSALTPGATPRIDNYYSKDALNLYLKARTHLQLNTTRLLKGNNVVIDYGEYITFGIPKIEIDKDGKKVLKYENEKEEDIWGTKLSQDDVIATLKNNKRRFLQNFQGLMEATKARRDANGLSDPNDQKLLTVFNLWLMNSLDHHSGTINPSLTGGTAKYMVWDSTKKRYVFKPGSLEILKGILKDGKGNKVEFEEVNGELIPKVVEGEKDANGNYIKINKVLMFNADGTPVINVPLNLDFNDKTSPYYDANALKYVNSKIKSIIETVKSLIVEKFSIRGWDNLDTDLSLEPKVIISNSYLNTLFGRGDFWIDKVNDLVYKAFVTNRDHENGGLKDANAPLPYYDEKGNLKVAPGVRLPQSSMYVNIKKYASVIGQQENLTSLMFAMNTAGNSFNNLVNSGEGYILHVDKDHQYLPNIKLANAFQNIFFYDQVKHLEEFLQLKKMLKWYSQYTSDFIGNDVNKHLWFAIDDSNSPLQILPNGKRNPNVKLMKINGRVVEKHPNLSLYNSFYSEENSQKSFGDQVEFKDYKKFLEFVSVDLKKAKLDKNTKTVNWDVNYVKGKVDFAKFITGLNDAIAKDKLLEQKDKDFYQKLVDNNNEQEIANEIMFRFSNSNLAMLMSNITIDDVKKNPEYGWVFDQAHGYGDLRSATLNTINPEAKKLEISLTEYIKAYEDKANEWNAQLNQFNLFDALIFDGKTSTYTSQTVGKMLENDNLVYSILITLGKGMIKKIKPSQDVLDYYGSKTERKFNEFFTDYTYNFAEVINRDNLQITYSPATSNFGNMPSYLSGLSEANTGLEYVVDGASTSKWLELLIKFRGNENSAGIRDTLIDYESLLNDEEKRRARILNTRHIERFFANSDNIIYGQNYSSNYFGKFQTINNGWFKDRWYREFLDFKLYDDEGKDIVDDTIRINDLEGKRVKTRARAYWQYYIQSQGVGRRNISGIWRDSDKDAVAMFGYLSSAVADKANYLAFKNVRTGQVKTLRITKQNASNMFYYKEQQINNEERHQNGEKVRHYLSDEPYNFSDKNGHQKGTGFVAWVSDYGIMSRYRNRLLDTNEEYYVYFASDVYGSKALEADLGKWESIAENGKTFSQAPISIYKDADGNFRLRVQDQFNGVI
ncbi:hypothetical protein NPA07_04485 [Mycoplasmopsis caviae]|uniref:PDxFFG protein n=1 Tax=Mycoplasmopsis caviae TaxID=55603 RepID=A0ABY5IY35_9BACT|nr:hypothetical protein [Mycoplasmopsis caviae]UUD35035.1 hypothetical protein NPA07_04485 [Mycoplasmopsis caviae]